MYYFSVLHISTIWIYIILINYSAVADRQLRTECSFTEGYAAAFFICAKGTSQADVLAYQFGAAREPELSRKARSSWF